MKYLKIMFLLLSLFLTTIPALSEELAGGLKDIPSMTSVENNLKARQNAIPFQPNMAAEEKNAINTAYDMVTTAKANVENSHPVLSTDQLNPVISYVQAGEKAHPNLAPLYNEYLNTVTSYVKIQQNLAIIEQLQEALKNANPSERNAIAQELNDALAKSGLSAQDTATLSQQAQTLAGNIKTLEDALATGEKGEQTLSATDSAQKEALAQVEATRAAANKQVADQIYQTVHNLGIQLPEVFNGTVFINRVTQEFQQLQTLQSAVDSVNARLRFLNRYKQIPEAQRTAFFANELNQFNQTADKQAFLQTFGDPTQAITDFQHQSQLMQEYATAVNTLETAQKSIINHELTMASPLWQFLIKNKNTLLIALGVAGGIAAIAAVITGITTGLQSSSSSKNVATPTPTNPLTTQLLSLQQQRTSLINQDTLAGINPTTDLRLQAIDAQITSITDQLSGGPAMVKTIPGQ